MAEKTGVPADGEALAEIFDHSLTLAAGPAGAAALPTTGGVYLFCDGHGCPILLAAGENLRQLARRRLDEPAEPSKRARLGDVAASVHWRTTYSRFETAWAHWQAAKRLYPRAYRKQLFFGPCWFVRVDARERTPRFASVKELANDGASYFGPLETQKAATDWIAMLEDAFDLCRYHHVLQQAPHGQACAYFDMGKCPAPCDGSISLDAYREMIAQAVEFCGGRREQRLESLQAAMQGAAAAHQFERAASFRQTLERATALPGQPAYRQLADLSTAGWLVIQRGGPNRRHVDDQLVRPCFVRHGLKWGEPVMVSSLLEAAPAWLERCGALGAADAADQNAREWSELVWLTARFLFEGERAPGLLVRFDQLGDSATLVESVRRRFDRDVAAANMESAGRS